MEMWASTLPLPLHLHYSRCAVEAKPFVVPKAASKVKVGRVPELAQV